MSRSGPTGVVHVLHVVYQLHPGGMEYGLVKLLNGLAAGPVRSTICSTRPAHPALAAQLHPSVRLLEVKRRPRGNDPLLMGRLYRLFRHERPAIVHTHAWGTLVEGLVAARLARVPLVVHGEHGTLQLRPYQARLQRWAWQQADALLSVSTRLAERMSATVGVPASAVRVVRNGVDLAKFGSLDRTGARHALGIDDDQVLVGHVGRLVEVKNQVALIEAAAQNKAAGQRFRVLIAGEGPLRGALEERIQALSVADCVRLLGHLSKVEQFFAALDIYVLCSNSEGMPNTILEAMAAGLPVVATRVGGTDELVEHEKTGLLVEAGDMEALRLSLKALATDSEARRRMGAAGRARAQREFSIEAMVRGYEGEYLRLVSPLGRPEEHA